MLVLALAAIGCGHPDAEPTIYGSWTTPGGGSCAIVFTATEADASYAIQQLCPLVGGGYGDEIESGALTIAPPGSMTLVARKSSCRASDHAPETDTYELTGGQLIVRTPDGAMVLDPVPAGGSAPPATIQFGCWAGDTFTPEPLQTL